MAQQRVLKLEAVLQTLGDEDTPKVKVIQDVLRKLQLRAPVGVQLGQCQQFVARCEKRVAALDLERSWEEANLQRVRQIVLLQILHQRWNSCGSKWPNCNKNWFRLGKHHARNVRPWFLRHGQFDYGRISCPCDADIFQWMLDRQAASRRKPHGECERSHEVVSRDSIWDFPICRFAVHGDEFHQVRFVQRSPRTQWPEARGEASDPVPASKRRRTQKD